MKHYLLRILTVLVFQILIVNLYSQVLPYDPRCEEAKKQYLEKHKELQELEIDLLKYRTQLRATNDEINKIRIGIAGMEAISNQTGVFGQLGIEQAIKKIKELESQKAEPRRLEEAAVQRRTKIRTDMSNALGLMNKYCGKTISPNGSLDVVVYSAKNYEPLSNATVSFGNQVLKTNSMGLASFEFNKTMKTNVSASSDRYKSASRPVSLIYDPKNPQPYTVDVFLAPDEIKKLLHVLVKEEYEPNKFRPANLVRITGIDGNLITGNWYNWYKSTAPMGSVSTNGVTDEAGSLLIEHATNAGTTLTLTANPSKPEQKPDTRKITITSATSQNIVFTLPYDPKTFKLTVLLIDEKTKDPVRSSSAIVKNDAGEKWTAAESVGLKGQHAFKLPKRKIGNYLRVEASAPGYEEKWSDVTQEQLQTEERLFTIYMKRKDETGKMVKYGPFMVDLKGWKSTGLRLKKNAGFMSEATGTLNYNDAWGTKVEMSPDGHGPWNFFVLKGKIGEDQFNLGSSGKGHAKEGGILELGAPRVNQFYITGDNPDGKGVTGTWTVYLWIQEGFAEKDDSPVTPKITEPVTKADNYIMKVDKTIFNVDEPIQLKFSNSEGSTQDWVSICKAGSTDREYGQWFYKGAPSTGEMKFDGLKAGDYEIRYYLNNGYEVKKRIPIKVN